ncbi:regulator of chromosome condensation [Culex quinquefasciatus]|uniref:Regulator of chromosome condensation n=1 Tax=Culex quinquefasciatus TaxID=7176 RepID=B0XK04_CULQU|nr:regulator of chromosome condensation [Culex quinquefasciatus]|eukprot:XP_001869976.1 regulator of chromosome condensation [Culex quinquefasciatus]
MFQMRTRFRVSAERWTRLRLKVIPGFERQHGPHHRGQEVAPDRDHFGLSIVILPENDHVNTVGFTKQSGVSSRGPPPVDTAGARLTFFKPGSSSRKARKPKIFAPNCHSEPGGMSSNQQLGTGNEEDEQRSLSASRGRLGGSHPVTEPKPAATAKSKNVE